MIDMKEKFIIDTTVSILMIGLFCFVHGNERELLNVSYDPTRELYKNFNRVFQTYWKEKTGQDIVIRQSHGGAGKQARSVIEGLEADVVTLALAYDIDAMHRISQLIPENWQSRLPNNSCPYTSTIVFLVRKDNPKRIKDWNDLIRPDIEVITPNPKTSGGARWNYLAAWGYALSTNANNESKAIEFISKLYQNVPVLDTGARGSTNTFIKGIGDVFISWENEALLAIHKLGRGQFEIVIPSLSILAEPPVTVIDKNVEEHGTRKIAEEYLKYLYTPVGQEICAKHYYRPMDPNIAVIYQDQFPKVQLFNIREVFGSWTDAQKKHFSDGGIFDQIYMDQ